MKKFLNILGNLEELAVGGLLLLLAVGTTIQVLTRYFLGLTFDWFDEGSRYLVVFATFAGAGLAVRHGAHFSNILSAVVMLVIAWFGWEQTTLLARYGMTMASLGLPMWVAYLPIPVFGLSIAARFGFKAWEHVRIVLAGEAGEGA